MDKINQGFPNLFDKGDPKDSGHGDQTEDDGTDSEVATDAFQEKWGWIANVDDVSETCRCSWDDVWKMSAIEFLTIICYKKDKVAKMKEDIEKFKRGH